MDFQSSNSVAFTYLSAKWRFMDPEEVLGVVIEVVGVVHEAEAQDREDLQVEGVVGEDSVVVEASLYLTVQE